MNHTFFIYDINIFRIMNHIFFIYNINIFRIKSGIINVNKNKHAMKVNAL